jgi:transposase
LARRGAIGDDSCVPDALDIAALPDDPAILRALLIEALVERDDACAARDALEAQNDRLRHILLKLQRHQFGRKSERLPEEQLELGLADLETAIATADAEAEKRDPDLRKERTAKRRASRGALPAHLPRIEVVLTPESAACPCCAAAMVEIGADTSERLDVIPAQFRVIVTKRPKLACRACAGVVVQRPAPARLVEGGLPTEATVAHVMVSRYADHLPLYRQAGILARQGILVDRATLAAWVGTGAAEIVPVVRRMKAILLASARLFADETSVPVLDPGRGKTRTGWFWTIARDDRPWGGPAPPAVVYTYAPGRGREHARALLGGYRGILQCDGYAGYKMLAAPATGPGPAVVAFCWSHARRQFYDLALKAKAPIAEEALRRIGALYAIEAEIRGTSPEQRLAERQARSRPLVEALFAWLEATLAKLPARSTMVDAIRYALNHRDGLLRFLDDGRIELDTNSVERAARPVALGRKNALFAGCDEGAEAWAAIASLIETCKLNGVDPQRYLTDLLTRLVQGWPQSRIDELMPWCWAKAGQA